MPRHTSVSASPLRHRSHAAMTSALTVSGHASYRVRHASAKATPTVAGRTHGSAPTVRTRGSNRTASRSAGGGPPVRPPPPPPPQQPPPPPPRPGRQGARHRRAPRQKKVGGRGGTAPPARGGGARSGG